MSQQLINKVLNMNYWPETLDTMKEYSITHDDNYGVPESGMLGVAISLDGDAWIKTYGDTQLRYRTPFLGGGKYPKIRNALLVLAEAIRQELDNE